MASCLNLNRNHTGFKYMGFSFYMTTRNSSSPDEAWELFETKIRSVLNHMCPIKTIRINKVKENWITNEILELIHDKDYFLRKAKETNNEDDWNITRRLRNRNRNQDTPFCL